MSWPTPTYKAKPKKHRLARLAAAQSWELPVALGKARAMLQEIRQEIDYRDGGPAPFAPILSAASDQRLRDALAQAEEIVREIEAETAKR